MSVDPYLIPGTDTLRNKAGITDRATLDNFEREVTTARSFELIAKPIEGNFDFDHLKDIHKHLFQDVYEWAGEPRTIGISKGGHQFEWPERLQRSADKVFGELAQEDHLKGLDRKEFVDRAAHYLNEINVLHPFREGNGRSQRAFMDHVAENAGRAFQWSKVTPKEMIDASIHGYAVDTSKLKDVLDKALVEPLKKKDRDERLADVAANDPQAHSLITDARNNILSLSEQNIESRESREQLADAVTDRLLSYHESGRDVKELLKQPDITQQQQRDPNRDDRSR